MVNGSIHNPLKADFFILILLNFKFSLEQYNPPKRTFICMDVNHEVNVSEGGWIGLGHKLENYF